MRSVTIFEHEDGTVEVEITHSRELYEFESWEDAIEATPNLDSI